MNVNRRDFLKAVGLTAGSTAAAAGASKSFGQPGEGVAPWATPEDQWTPSVCQQCPAGCGLLVRTLDGVVAGIRGNPLHPVNRGALCVKAYGALQLVADPDRFRGPLRRVGERGSGRFEPIGWDEALDLLAARLNELRTGGLAHTVAILGGQYRGLRDTLWERFARSYGTPNYIRVRCIAPERPALSHRLMQGVTSPLAYDLHRANYVLAFGVGLLESWISPVWTGRAFGSWRAGSERPRGTLVVVDSRRSLTAAAADRWVPIRPGTDGVLALGIANVLLRERLYDQAFIDEYTVGFEDWADPSGRRHRGLRTIVLQDYGPLAVSQRTGVPVETITGIARQLARIRPAVVVGERGPAFGTADLETRMAIHALNALIGSVGVEGGVVLPGELPLAPLPSIAEDDLSKQGLAQPRIDGAGDDPYRLATDAPQALPTRVLSGEPYPVNALLLFGTNPVVSLPAGAEMTAALQKIPFVASFSPFPDESSRLADLVLPDHVFLERWQDDPVTHLAGFTAWSLGRPANRPRHDTRDTGDVILGLAQRLGGPAAESLAWQKYDDVLYDAARGLYEAERGYVVAPREEEWVRRVQEQQGYWTPEFDSFDDFWDALGERGAWWDPAGPPASARAVLGTRTGKFHFFATGADGNVLGPEPPPAAADTDDAFPLVLSTYRLATRPMGGGRNQPWLMESPAAHVPGVAWQAWVEIHPDDARPLGVSAGDEVWIESPKGRIRVIAKLHDGTAPGVVHVPMAGVGGATPNAVIPDVVDPTRGLGLFNTTRVRIRRV
jgi:anaerobic selenocysteine-containing dehydrogenase